MGRRSSVKDLPEPIRAEVDAAIKRGATIDAIVEHLHALGADHISRSAVGRYSKGFAELARQQRDLRIIAEQFGREFGDSDNLDGRLLTQLMTSVMTRAILPIASGEIVQLDGKDLHFLARATKDAMAAAKIDTDREAKIREEEAKRARAAAADAADQAGRAAGASEETLRRIRAGILGIDAQ
ncbi:MAG TPA: phage protein Gp27 family protein [Sphingomonas sp.]|nr:phage protein Gp27 family protein [Sphingomonas sp.]